MRLAALVCGRRTKLEVTQRGYALAAPCPPSEQDTSSALARGETGSGSSFSLPRGELPRIGALRRRRTGGRRARLALRAPARRRQRLAHALPHLERRARSVDRRSRELERHIRQPRSRRRDRTCPSDRCDPHRRIHPQAAQFYFLKNNLREVVA